jgi:hypothetical protein
MAASAQLMTYLHGLGLTDAQIASLLASVGGTDGNVSDEVVKDAAVRYYAAIQSGALNGSTGGTGGTPGGGTGTPGGGTGTPGTPQSPIDGPFAGRVSELGSDYAGAPNPIDPQAIGGTFSKDSPQGKALANPDQSYIDTSQGDQAFTPNTARAWWDQYAAAPTNMLTISPGQTPGTLVLTPEQLAQMRALQAPGNTLPAAQQPNDPNSFGGYGSAAAALQASPILTSMGNGTVAQAQYLDALKSLGVTNPVYSGPGFSTAAPNPNYVPQEAVVPTYINGARMYQTPDGRTFASQEEANAAYLASPQRNTGQFAQYAPQTPPAVPASASQQNPVPQGVTGPNAAAPGATQGGQGTSPFAPTTPTVTTPPPKVDYSAAIATNQGYVNTLSAIPAAQRTPAQNASLAAAQAHIADYSTR